ncbi:MAG TPA: lytic transglycosylase domain-containing protein [Bryobacteraceae bacterium]|jgi:soluble lytic murein transglycosylase-like protein
MRKAIFLLILFGGSSHAEPALSMREYARRCAAYYAREYHLDPVLVRAVIQVESAWNPGAVSSAGAMGLMQLMPETARRYGARHPFWIHENIRAGAAYLADLVQLFHGDLRLVMAAYNAGEKQVLARQLGYTNRGVYGYVSRIAEEYRAELGRKP